MQCNDHTKVVSQALRTAQMLQVQVRETPAEKSEHKALTKSPSKPYEISIS